METFESALQSVDKDKIKTAIRLSTPIQITTYTLPRNMELYMHEVLSVFLKECHQEHMDEYLNFCLGELLTNSKKANTKRIYFKEKKLDINNTKDYELGMKTFKDDTFGNIDHYLLEQKKAGLYIKLILQVYDDLLKIEIRNNSVLCKFEEERIKQKLSNVKQYKNEKDVLNKVLDQVEGAGLGIIIIILMLQKIGLSKENYRIFSTDKETITRIELPLNNQKIDDLDSLYSVFIENQTTIPVLKENYAALSKVLAKKFVSANEIIDVINKDVTLSYLLLKNSILENKENYTYTKAIESLGIEKVKEIFDKKNTEIKPATQSKYTKKLWDNARKVAFYAYNLAKNTGLDKKYSLEDIYISALLHDIECILIAEASDKQKNAVENKSKELNIPNDVKNMFVENSLHNKGGALFLEKNNFPAIICNVVKFHNKPENAPSEYKVISALIYFADMIQYYVNGKIEFYQINEDIKKLFKFDKEDKLRAFIKAVESELK